MNKAQQFLKILENEEAKEKSSLDLFLQPSKEDQDQEDAIEKFRLKKQLTYMKKFQNDPSNDKDKVMPGKDKEYYWDANVSRVSGG